jgi:hypothetical protein
MLKPTSHKEGKIMAKYRIEVKVSIKECSEEPESDVTKQQDGSFRMVIDEADAISIDRCEQALLMTNYPRASKNGQNLSGFLTGFWTPMNPLSFCCHASVYEGFRGSKNRAKTEG